MIYYICGKSGSGKSTLIDALSKEGNLTYLPSYTNRPKRPNESDNRYNFVAYSDYYTSDNIVASYEVSTYSRTGESQLWHYYIKSCQINPDEDYILEGTPLLAYQLKDAGYEVTLIYLKVKDSKLLTRCLNREIKTGNNNFLEMCRRFINDTSEFKDTINKSDIILDNDVPIKESLERLLNIINKEPKCGGV